MKNKKFVLLSLVALLALAMTACIFESDEDGLANWLSDQGMPNSYKVQTLNIPDLKVASAEVFMDTFPTTADYQAVLGHGANLTHDLVLDFAFIPDTNFMKKFSASDTSGAFLTLSWLRPLYTSKYYPSDSLPIQEDLKLNVSWKLNTGKGKKFLDSLSKVADTTWYRSLEEWGADGSADTIYSVKVSAEDTAFQMKLPAALMDDLKKINGAIHLQLRLSAPDAQHVYRFYGDASKYPPIFAPYIDSTEFLSPAPNPFRMANVVKNEEDCGECPVLHGAVFDSLVVELPSEPILKALSEFYGDEFPYKDADENDVRQTVIHAQLTMARDDSKGQNELGLPIQVVAGSFVDSAGKKIRRMESYRLDNEVILEKGHQNLVFHEGDSLTLQLTEGARDFINKASDGRTMKFIMRLGWPFLQEKDTTYENYKTADGDTSYVRLSYFDYARYDFSTAMDNPVTLKLWLASKRGDEE